MIQRLAIDKDNPDIQTLERAKAVLDAGGQGA
jgi:hypothetical protein